ncbi:MAG: hypothetical protein U0169_13370 [Polyangiaceae bacterium]
MANPLFERLTKELDDVSAEYESRFAGQSRSTRELRELDALVDRVQKVIAQLDTIPAAAQGQELIRVRQVATENLSLYQNEHKAIAEAKAAGPEFEEFAPLATNANFVFARYHRHFAGKSRATRDLALLEEMVVDLQLISDEMGGILKRKPSPNFARDKQLVEESLASYRNEIEEIGKAQKAGTPEDQANLLANLANDQFAIYRVHFANRSRVTRRPALLQRMIKSLTRHRTRMEEIKKGGFSQSFHDTNIGVVSENLRMYETELAEVRKARQSTAMNDLQGALGGAANELFEAYGNEFGGKPRNTVSLERLTELCDLLGEIARQMGDLGRANANEMNSKNLEIVNNYLATFEREYELIEEAKKASAV